MTTTRGTILVLPGGGYSRLADHEGEPIAHWLRGLGWDARVVRYPVGVRHPMPLDAVRAEVAAERAAGASVVGVIGFSAGGHLAGHAALAPSAPHERPDFAVLSYPVTSFVGAPHVRSRAVLVGDDPSVADVPVQHSYVLAQALAAARVPHELHVFPGDIHGVGLASGTAAAAWTGLCTDWLTRWDAEL
ncbi:acetyl esterase/lipase [Microbacterium terrae]|uniref:Acetylxylan esterase n=1 Tax=Microbacterium terrae TaxID=69369 RepID=A0A0M2H4M0_9MICO|nr:alpha/beta hydrolase fold domain-containing protein [Microbacterium terrae]KJL38687.1 Acetylxylan esterase precursor [Microbacterium terrae]MBP1076106.1 acetyl esterase/lipase [Microbacterium terrae]GLJ96926.1 hypothetical protein GCM10017594_01230 [Microbacterium terrae]